LIKTSYLQKTEHRRLMSLGGFLHLWQGNIQIYH